MQDFTFQNPTKIIFGAGAAEKVAAACAEYGNKVLLVTGKNSVRESGLLDRVLGNLKSAELDVTLFEGVRANPVLSHLRMGIEIARTNKVNIVLAVGGGSVLDTAKAIAAGCLLDSDVWDLFVSRVEPKAALPLVTILTLAATGSEMNGGSVVTNEETSEKYFFGSMYTYPRVSFLDPSLTLSVSAAQTANGISDSFAHVIEPYLNNMDPRPLLQMEISEAILRTARDTSVRLMSDLHDLDARAEFMWTATMALNGVTFAGVGPAAWPLHMIEHSVSAVMDVAHGAGLSALFSGWANWKLDQDGCEDFAWRLTRLGEKVFAVESPSPKKTIVAVMDWFNSYNSPSCLKDAGVTRNSLNEIADNATRTSELWGLKAYGNLQIAEILERAF
jgi:NADP-dependent alcohol dehydrogenase